MQLFYITFWSISFADAKNDPFFVEDISKIWRLLLTQGISIAAFIDNPNGGKSVIVATNILGVAVKNEKNKSYHQVSSLKTS